MFFVRIATSVVGTRARNSSHLIWYKLVLLGSIIVETIKEKIIAIGIKFKKRTTMGGNSLYLVRIKGVILGSQVTNPENKITSKTK